MVLGIAQSDTCLAGLDFVFHMFFLIKYSSSLEEGSFRSSSADFLWMLIFGMRPSHVPSQSGRAAKLLLSLGLLLTPHLTWDSWQRCHRWHAAHLNCPLCEHPVSGLISDIHDGASLQRWNLKCISDTCCS